MSSAPSPLAGVRVLDLGSPIGAYCTRLLADLGADVVLVEPPEGDACRRIGPYLPPGDGADSSLTFAYYQAGKRSISLDLTDDGDRGILADLGNGSDVIVISPSHVEPLWGFDVETRELAWAADGSVVCSITPFGIGGPYWWRPVTHLTSFAQGGQMSMSGEPSSAPPSIPHNLQWHLTAAHAAVAVLAALGVRERTGGQFIDMSAQEVEAYQTIALIGYHVRGYQPGQRDSGYVIPPSGVWTCADGRIDIAAHTNRHWDSFLEMLDHPEELSEPSLADMAIRRQIFDGLVPIIDGLVSGRERNDLFDRGQRAGLPICLRNTPAEFVADSQHEERGFLVDLPGGESGPVLAPGAPVASQPALFGVRRGAPRLDEHRSEILAENRARSAVETSGPAPATSMEGTRVLSLGAFVAGNTCAQLLAGLGAEVAKVESLERPEALRDAGYNEALTLAVEPSGVSNTPMQSQLTRGLKSIGLDLSKEEGRQALRTLVGGSDVIIENFGGEVMAAWGCSYEDLLEVNPRLIMVSLSGYGRTGPRSTYRAYASNIASFTGLTEMWSNSGTLTDYVVAVHAVAAVLAALRHVADAGEPVRIDASQCEAFAAMAAAMYLEPLAGGEAEPLEPNAAEHAIMTHVVRCDGQDRWAALEIEDLDQWNTVCDLLDRPDLRVEPDSTNPDTGALQEALDGWAAPLTPRTVGHVLSHAGIPAASVASTEEVYDDPQLNSRGCFEEVSQPDLGHLVFPRPPQAMSVTPAALPLPPPRLGQHTGDILSRWARMSEADIASLVDSGAAFDAS